MVHSTSEVSLRLLLLLPLQFLRVLAVLPVRPEDSVPVCEGRRVVPLEVVVVEVVEPRV